MSPRGFSGRPQSAAQALRRGTAGRVKPGAAGYDPALGSVPFRLQVDRAWRAFFARRGIDVGSHTFSRTTLAAFRRA